MEGFSGVHFVMQIWHDQNADDVADKLLFPGESKHGYYERSLVFRKGAVDG